MPTLAAPVAPLPLFAPAHAAMTGSTAVAASDVSSHVLTLRLSFIAILPSGGPIAAEDTAA